MKSIAVHFNAAKLALAAIALLALGATAPAQAGQNWTGCYGLLGGGYSAAVAESSIDVAGVGTILDVDGFGADGRSLTVGGGCDGHLGDFVVGGWIDYTDDKLETSISLGAPLPAGTLARMEIENRLSYGVRGGYLLTPDVLAYGLVGRTHANVSDLTSPLAGLTFPAPDFKGWVVGGGTEIALDYGFSFQAQYTYTMLGDESIPLASAFGPGVSNGLGIDVHTIRAAVTWKVNFFGPDATKFPPLRN